MRKEKIKKWKIGVLLLGIIIVAGFVLIIIQKSSQMKKEQEYQLGKTPHSYQFTFGEDILLYKDNVNKNGEMSYSGLFVKQFNEDKNAAGTLLSDSYYGCANLYEEQVIFIDADSNIVKTDLQGNKKEIIVKSNGYSIQDALLIEDVLYYIQETEGDIFALQALDLKSQEKKKIADAVNPHYLYHYCGNVAVIDKKQNELVICNEKEKIIKRYDDPGYEIQGFLNDGTIIYMEEGKLYQKHSFETKKAELLFDQGDIYRVVVKPKEMLVCTIDGYGLMQVFFYHFSQKNLEKIANANTVPRDFNDNYIVCASEEEGMGSVELISREQGDIFSIHAAEGKIGSAEKVSESEQKNDKKMVVVSEEPEKGNYKEKVSEEEKEKLEQLLVKYYKEKIPYPLVSYHVSENDNPDYQERKMPPGNILIYWVKTEHEGEGSLYRHITFVRENENAEWQVLGEGY